MLRSLWRFLTTDRVRDSRRPARPFTCRPSLEGLEDRVTPSANQFGSTLNVFVPPNTTALFEVDSIDHTKLDVFENGVSQGQFSIASITSVGVQVSGNDTIKFDDSNGFPFASGTSISLFGVGNNSMVLQGNQAVTSGNEVFVAGSSTQKGSLAVDGSTFQFTSAIPKVTDDLPSNGTLFVETTASGVSLAGPNGVTETLSGLAGGAGAGNTLTFREKVSVDLQVLGNNATTTLNATQAAHGLQSFTVEQRGTNDTVDINAAPSFAGNPNGETLITDPGNQDVVNLRANAGPVNIFGVSSTTVVLGSNDTDFSKSVTAGINGPVSVHNVGVLNIEDAGNTKTQENVTVTESSITGTGLFGPHGSVQYSSITPGQLAPAIFTGQLANTYTVEGSSPTASFNGAGNPSILIEDNSTTAGLTVTVNLTAATDLALSLVSKDAAASSLFISAPSGSFFNPFIPPIPIGFIQVSPPGATKADGIFYEGFDNVLHS
jgi:hypothetical protein